MLTTEFSGNDLYCLSNKGYQSGKTITGSCVYPARYLKSLETSRTATLGEELKDLTQFIQENRHNAFLSMLEKANKQSGVGIIYIENELIHQPGYIEFLSSGSIVHSETNHTFFSTSASPQEFYALTDLGFKPLSFIMGNSVYSSGSASGIFSGFKTFSFGEIKEMSAVMNATRQLPLERMIVEAKLQNANAIMNIKTLLLPLDSTSEILMYATAVSHEKLSRDEFVTSHLNPIELWNLSKLNYQPVSLVMGSCVYSLGLRNNINAVLKSFYRKENTELSKMMYNARENSLNILDEKAKSIGAEKVIGTSTYIFQLGHGFIEFFSIGTAIRKSSEIKTISEQLPVQVVTINRNTFYNGINAYYKTSNNTPITALLRIFVLLLLIIIVIWLGLRH